MSNDENNEIVRKTAESLVARSAESYSTNQWLRALVALIPYIGGSLDILLSHRHFEIVQKRLACLIEGLSEKVSSLDQSKIDRVYLESEDWHDLFLLSLEKASRVASKDRIRAIAAILAKPLIGEAGGAIEPFDLVQIVGELTEQEAMTLSLVGQLYRSHPDLLTGSYQTLFTTKSLQSITLERHRDAMPLLLSRLVGKGLLDTIAEYFSKAPATDEILNLYDEADMNDVSL